MNPRSLSTPLALMLGVAAPWVGSCVRVAEDFGGFGTRCSPDKSCGADLVCHENVCVLPRHVADSGTGEGEGEGEPEPALCAPGPATLESLEATEQDAFNEQAEGVRCVTGDVVLGDGIEDTEALAQLELIEGDLRVTGAPQLLELALPALHEVHGDLVIGDLDIGEDGTATTSGNDNLTTVSLAGLWVVEGSVVVAGNQSLESLVIGDAATDGTATDINGSLLVYENPQLDTGSDGLGVAHVGNILMFLNNSTERSGGVSWSFPVLKDIGKRSTEDPRDVNRLGTNDATLLDRLLPGCAYFGSPSTTSLFESIDIRLPALLSVDQILAFQGGGLTDLALPALEEAGALEVTFSESARTLVAPELGSLTGLDVEDPFAIYIYQAPALTSLEFAALRALTGHIVIRETGLTSLCGFGALESVNGDLNFQDNPDLPGCEVEALAAQVGTREETRLVTNERNADTGPSCEIGPCVATQ